MIKPLHHRTKIVATIGPASKSPEIIRQMVNAGMNVARLNFSHGSYEDHAEMVGLLRQVSKECNAPITLLQDLQGPKIRIGQLPSVEIELVEGELLTLVPLDNFENQANTVPIDYPYLAEEAEPGAQVLLDDGLLELKIEEIQGNAVKCRVIEGGILKSRKGVNLPSLILRLPSLTEKDQQDLDFGISQGVDWVSLSFVRRAEDVQALKALLIEKGASDIPVMAKIEKPQAIANLESIINECDGLMVARGDLGVEMSPEKVPLLQKQIIRMCNQKGIPVITATQMLDSMIHSARPTRAEASDVANAIIDGTDAVMLSGESAVGKFPVKAVQMLSRIASDVEPEIEFKNYPPVMSDETHALSEALNTIDKVLNLHCIVAYTSTGYTAILAAGERPKVPVIALTPNLKVYHRLNLVWGVKPILLEHQVDSFEGLIDLAQTKLLEGPLAQIGDKILIIGGVPTKKAKGTNFLKIHTIAD
ncbi:MULTISPECIES: pyruvate kinase [Planktothrix]|uniref:Pyruvate kinase n=3 Tax=Planktothrix TaxID=54304 RepID=A0A4P5ZEZ9_PLAAG|nr:Pyk [Planktothrix agardhii No758]CAC5345046.1 Pyruvate kinase 1 [Planktothrix rubescens NIVA-CYA 18]CAD5971978.1 Pyruvate kinase 1 [Planktothrix agardhii]CAD5978563.1 Pyruvate kinase 1 [Planktothrix rubescens]GDZ94638.1 pyruvate kinase [Planktothrix agardhii CCAP 1459/11A]